MASHSNSRYNYLLKKGEALAFTHSTNVLLQDTERALHQRGSKTRGLIGKLFKR